MNVSSSSYFISAFIAKHFFIMYGAHFGSLFMAVSPPSIVGILFLLPGREWWQRVAHTRILQVLMSHFCSCPEMTKTPLYACRTKCRSDWSVSAWVPDISRDKYYLPGKFVPVKGDVFGQLFAQFFDLFFTAEKEWESHPMSPQLLVLFFVCLFLWLFFCLFVFPNWGWNLVR